MADICFRTQAFATDPEGDLEYCNGMPGSRLANWIRDGLLKKGYSCREPLQEDYGWGFWLDADDCSVWVSASYAAPDEEDAAGVPEWHVGVDYGFAPWAVRQWFRKRRGRELSREVYAHVKEMIASLSEATIVEED
ncbi:MAG: hypothetical protein MUF25_07255 [Pirellulaceae bacterium]|jgi:hypothetical protein|nr:hypothetical protein [Pirellulaceae bacterium]MCU0978950.1 hypothetical protein [Pirellulaceae bacterium]